MSANSQGVTASKSRSRSLVRKISEGGEEQPDNIKRGRVHTSGTMENKGEEDQEFEKMMRAIKRLMADDEFSNMLIGKMKKALDVKDSIKGEIKEATSEIKEEIVEMKEVQNVQHEKISSIDRRVEDLEQDRRSKNLIIRGLNAGQNAKQACMIALNDKLKTKLQLSDIKYAVPIGKDGSKLIKLAMKTASKRDEIYSARPKLKGSDVWITEDLIPSRASLAFKARQAVKNGKATLTWTNEGKIFIKHSPLEKPKLVKDENDLDPKVTTEATPSDANNGPETVKEKGTAV